MIQSLQYRRASFLGNADWQTIPWELTPKDVYQRIYDYGFKLAAILEQIDNGVLLTPGGDIFKRSECLRRLSQLDTDMDQWFEELLDNTPPPIYWPAHTLRVPSSFSASYPEQGFGSGALPSFEFRTLRLANITVTYWALRTILSNTMAIFCGAILSSDATLSSDSSGFDILRTTAQQLLVRHGAAARLAYATNIMRSMPYCLNDNKGLLGAQKSLFALRTALFSLRRHPGEELRWCSAVYQQLDESKGLRYAREIAKFDGKLKSMNTKGRDCISNSIVANSCERTFSGDTSTWQRNAQREIGGEYDQVQSK